MVAVLQALTGILGRLCLCALFLYRTLSIYIPHFSQTVGDMRRAGAPYSKMMLGTIIGFSLLGSALVVSGLKARFGAFLLLVILVMTTYYFDDFWHFSFDAPVKLTQTLKNLGLAGAMLMIIANGPGAGSLQKSR